MKSSRTGVAPSLHIGQAEEFCESPEAQRIVDLECRNFDVRCVCAIARYLFTPKPEAGQTGHKAVSH
jgi:hypothetical protein